MKKVLTSIMTISLFFLLIPSQLKADEVPTPVVAVATENADLAKAEALVTRLNEINMMDLKELKGAEKRELRKELRDIKGELSELTESDTSVNSPAEPPPNSGGIYLSVGAAILIVLLLILIL